MCFIFFVDMCVGITVKRNVDLRIQEERLKIFNEFLRNFKRFRTIFGKSLGDFKKILKEFAEPCEFREQL